MSPNKNIKIYFLPFIFIAVVAFMAYGNSLGNNFVGDDYTTVVNNNLIRSWKNLPLVFSKNYIPKQSDFYYLPSSSRIGIEINYRPVRLFTYFIDYKLWHLNPFGYHLSNIAYHILTGILLYILFLVIGVEQSVSLLGALLFTVHPVQFEAVNSITFRGDILYALFYVLSLILFIQSIRQRVDVVGISLYFLSMASFVLCLLSKESAISLPFILIIYDLHFNFNYHIKNTFKYFLRRYLAYFVILAFYVWIYLFMQKQNLHYHTGLTDFLPNFVAFAQLFYKYMTLIFKEIGFYLKTMILPSGLPLLVMDELPFSLSSPLLSLTMGLILLFISCYALFKLYKPQRYFTFAAMLFIIPLFPLLNISILQAFLGLQSLKFTVAGYRFLYLPLSGFCLGLAMLIRKIEDYLTKNRPCLINKKGLIGFSLIIIYITLNIPNNLFFKNDYIFSSELINQWPKSTISHQYFAAVLEGNGEIDQALKHYDEIIKLGANTSYIHYRIGYCYLLKGMPNKAEEEFKESLRLFPDNFYSNYYLGELYLNKGNFTLSIQYFKKAKELSPVDIPTIINLGVAYFKNQNYQDAQKEWRAALRIEPNSGLAKRNLAILNETIRKTSLTNF